MSAVYTWRVAIVALVLAAFVAVYFISPIAEALNTHSVDFESGSNQYLSIADESQTGLDLSGNFTVEAWIKLETLPTTLGYSPSIISKEGSTSGWNLRISTDNNKLDWVEDGQIQYTASTAFTTGTWYHVAVTHDSGNIRMYVDGNLELNTSYGGHTSNSLDVEVGRSPTYTTRYFDGHIDDMRVWDVARTAQEITNNKGGELNGNETGLVAYWKLNNSLADLTGNDNTLTNNNGATFSDDVPFLDMTAPTLTFSAVPSTITPGATSTLSWFSTDATSCTASGGWAGSKALSGSEDVMPTTTTLYALDCVGDGGSVQKQATVTVNPPPLQPMSVRKSADESVVGSAALQNDDQLSVGVAVGKAYEVEGVIFATSDSGTPDLRTAYVVPSGSDITVGYIATGANGDDEFLQTSGASSARIAIPANQIIQVVVHGTIVAGADGVLQLQWAQFASNQNAVTVKKGSYLRAEEL